MLSMCHVSPIDQLRVRLVCVIASSFSVLAIVGSETDLMMTLT